jgi:hypothetical protein
MATFVYPRSRQFPFDEVCERIVRELEARNWDVPGIKAEFSIIGSGEAKFRFVSRITSDDFRLWFCRKQGVLIARELNDIAAVTQLTIPEKELHVYHEESGPSFYIYAGEEDYENNREAFMTRLKVNSKLDQKPRLYLCYKGRCRCGGSTLDHMHPGRRSPLLVHNNDLGREYDPIGNEPHVFKTDEVMEEFRQYLSVEVLPRILAHPLPEELIDIFASQDALIPFPSGVGSVFCFVENDDVKRIRIGQKDKDQLPAHRRFALPHSGKRLVAWDVKNDGTLPEEAYEGFRWCALDEVSEDTPIGKLNVPGHYRWPNREQYVVRVTPTCANKVFIADHAAYERARDEVLPQAQAEDRSFTDAEIDQFNLARGRTIIPITEYKGGFKQPIVLISRELGFDEVEIVSGPHKGHRGF